VPVADRLDVTLRLVRGAGTIGLAELAGRLGVSEMTVRRDLDALQARGLVQRVRGGAVAVGGPDSAVGFDARAQWQAATKQRLGAAVAERVPRGSTVLLDAGTTTVSVAAALAARAPLTVAVLSLQAAARLVDVPGVRLIVVGGEARPGEHSLVGPLTAAALRSLSFDLFVLSIGGISAAVGWSEFSLEDAAAKQAGLASAEATIAVADATKLGVRAFARVADLGEVPTLVTDTGAADPDLPSAAAATLAALHDAHVEVVLA
jgi:DeoR/GlpR family transcriptional regulator of sugar metabolism